MTKRPDSSGTDLVQLALLGEAFAHAPGVAVFLWDDDRNYVAVNDCACELVGLTRDELLRLRVGDLSPNRASPHFEEAQRRAVHAGHSDLLRPTGEEVPLDWVTFKTNVGGLQYLTSVCWLGSGPGTDEPAATLAR